MYGRVPSLSTSSPGHEDDSAARAELEQSLPNVDEHCLVASLDLSKAYDTT